jgi:cell filamentation protein
MADRYDTSDNLEGQFQPGSGDQVLANKLDISDPTEMDDVELVLLEELQVGLLDDVESDQRITLADLCNWHREWLGTVYSWAGKFRTVNLQ